QEQIAPFIRGYFIEPVKNRLLRPVKKLSSIRRKIRWSSQVVQAIFLHLPKAAGSSIERVCSDERIPIDTLNQAWCKIDAHAAEFEGWFKFGFVRNPWDKMVSSWQMFSTWRRPEWFPVLPFEEFLKIAFAPREPEKISCERVWKKKDGNPEEMAYYRDQYLMSIHNHSLYQCHPFYKMFDQSGKQLVDFVGRFEYLQSDFDKICEIVGIHPRKLPHLNSSEHKHYSFYYDDETRNLVDEYYHQDIEQFGYHFEDNAK
ncbi:MAG TPA: sulfotransferase family 2 domain-containing protein, partial [Cyclobacteriaceae bacterium]|nr:sulfotransferase family 2 domain-containing protein [Cyclobacteriaceae bacterium]